MNQANPKRFCMTNESTWEQVCTFAETAQQRADFLTDVDFNDDDDNGSDGSDGSDSNDGNDVNVVGPENQSTQEQVVELFCPLSRFFEIEKKTGIALFDFFASWNAVAQDEEGVKPATLARMAVNTQTAQNKHKAKQDPKMLYDTVG